MPRVHGVDLPRHRRRPAVLSRSSSTFSNSHYTRNFGSGAVGIHFTSFGSNSEGTAKAVANNCAYSDVDDAKSITPRKIEPLPKKDLDSLKFGNKSFSVATISISSAGNDTRTTIATRNSSTMHITNSGSLGNSSTATNLPLSDQEDTSNKENQHTNIPDRVDQDQMKSSASSENAAEERVDEGKSPKQKDADNEYKYEDDSSVTTMRDDGSIDLLQDDDGNQNGKRAEFSSGKKPKNKSQDSFNEKIVQSPKPTATKCIGKPRSKFTPSPISPATQTLNRLASVGIQVENLTQVDGQPKKDDGGDGSDKSFHLLAVAATNKWEEQNCKREDNEKKQNEKQAESIRLKNHGKADASEYESEECNDEDDKSTISSENQFEKTPRPARKIPNNCSNHEAKSKKDQIKSKKEQVINHLKSYFMTTKNSSDYAKKANVEAPLVPFCHRCTNTIEYLPHHALCPKHPDFFNSGSYEILCILVDGFDHKCEACMFQFDNGRPNKKLTHAPTCNRSDNKKCSGFNESESQQTKSSLSCKQIRVDVSLAVSAQSGCRKCKQELETGQKCSLIHDTKCPRRRNTKHLPPLSVSASSGCKKCIREMRTGCASSRGHDKCCPRRRKVIPRNEKDEGDESMAKIDNITPRKRKERPPLAAFAIPTLSPVSLVDAAEVCKKCRTELNGGVKTANAHDPSCPRKRANRVSRELQSLQHPKDDMLARELGTYQTIDQRESSDGVADFVPGRNLGSASKEEPAGFDDEIQSLKNNDRDSDEPPLSEYERLRLKNIQRNESRLAQLGLLVPSSNKDGKSRSTLRNLLDSGKSQNRGRRGKKKAAPKSMGRRSLPNRRTKCEHSEKQNISGHDSSSSTKSDGCYGSSPRTGDICVPSSSTSTNNDNCSGSSPRTSHASDPSSSKIEYQKSTSTNQNTDGKELEEDGCVGQRRNQIEAKLHKAGDRQSGEKKEVKSNIFVSSGHNIKHSKKRRDASEVSLVLAAKSGCKKYRMEWQTERQDLPSINDLHPRRHSKVSAKHDDDRTSPPDIPLIQKASLLNRFQSATRSITPSPTHQSSNPPDFPSFVASFISKPSDMCDSEIPAPKGAKWLPCPNPWGEVGHNEGDFVVISPFQSESANTMLSAFHQGPNFELPRRFLANPLEKDSCYLSTHRSPTRGGYSVLSLKRDRMGMKPWGFTVRRHEFGGACLVQSVEPLSPAVGAEDISGWQNEDSSLKIYDMILCINGKTVGGMTEFEFQIEMDLCGPSMTLVVSRFDILESEVATHQRNNSLGDLAMDWTDVGAGVLVSNKCGCSNANAVNPAPYLADQTKNRDCEFEGSLTAEQTSPPMQQIVNDFFDQENNKTQSTDCYHMHHHFSNTNPIIPSRTKKKSATSTSTNEGKLNSHNNLHNPPTKNSMQSFNDNSEPVIKNTCEPDHIGDSNGYEGGLSKLYSTMSNNESSKEACPDLTRDSASGSENIATKQYSSQTPKRRDIEYSYRKPSNPARFPSKAVKRPTRMLDEHSYSSSIEVEEPPTGLNNTKPMRQVSEACSVGKEKRQGNQVIPKISDEQSNDDSSHFSIENEAFVEEDSDENPWLGCVCGNTHPHPIRVFWIQCESCESWHNVAEECVGFDEKKAEILDEWFCWACKPPVAGLGL